LNATSTESDAGLGVKPGETGPRGDYPTFAAIRQRILSGIVLALPIVITFWIIFWLYSTLQRWLIDPVAQLVRWAIGEVRYEALPWWWQQYVSPLIAVALVLVFLYFLGLFVRTRLHRAVDRLLLKVPVVTVIYKSVRSIFDTLGSTSGGANFKRSVLVPFPSRDVRSPGFVTGLLRDEGTGRTILCVYVPYSPIPTTGLILMVPEEEVVELDWDVSEVMQAVMSFGMSSPRRLSAFATNGPAGDGVSVAGVKPRRDGEGA
jgi:uncharacterized membrane protein